MKKGTVKYIVGGSLVIFGILLTVIAVCIGGWETLTGFKGINIGSDGINYYYDEDKYGTAGGNYTMEKGNIKNLNIEVDYGKLIIKTDNIDEVKIDTKNIISNKLSWEQSGDTLRIKYGGGFSFFTWKSNAEITVTLPNDMVFDKAVIKNGAGKTNITSISASDFSIDNGAGELTITDISAKNKLHFSNGAGAVKMNNINCGELELHGGVGEINIKDIICSDLEVENGIGAFSFEGEINGNADIDNGIGEIRMTVYGNSSDYGFDVESGIGNVRVNGNAPVSYSNSKYKFKIDTGVGEVRIDFKEKD